jgi:hypothetical protein
MINMLTLLPGTKLKIVGDRIAEVVENMQDGQWVMVRMLVSPASPSEVGQEELCHSQDILDVVASDASGS